MATPLAWQAIGFLLLAALIATAAFLATGSYARVETVPGEVTLDRGVATIIPSRPGIVQSMAVTEGQHVHAGQVLLYVRSEEAMIGGNTAPERIRRALNEQDARLVAQNAMTLRAAQADEARLREQVHGGSQELASLNAQADDQQRLIVTAQSDYDNARQIAANGFISKHDIDTREATLLSRRQQLSQLSQLRSAKLAELAAAERSIDQSGASAEAQVANTQASRAALLQQIAQADLSRGYAMVAPVDGMVTALTARIGQPVSPQQQLMMVLPTQAVLSVELYVPTAAAGFLREGQEVRFSVDAFPYQSFGTIPGRIRKISAAAVARQAASGQVPVYLVTADLIQPWVKAFGRKQRLLPGMALSARIITEKRSLLEWLFEPIFAVRDR
ncbi:HlyD family efflux transporter periplasmic adaptor subunit [Sphingomonas sp. RT2P30]|uniref:HlyD family secretion protein n=1 Tax=Parasphingomonas halimpatiens TaxID=3096162 RepID=UPI002FC72AAD